MEAWVTYEKGKFYLCRDIMLDKEGWIGEGVMAVLSKEDLPKDYIPKENPIAVEIQLQPRRKELIKFDPSHVDLHLSDSDPVYKYTAKSLDDIIPFGKYKGYTLKAVFNKGDWRYIQWLNDEHIVYYPSDLRGKIKQTIYLMANYKWPNPDYFDYVIDSKYYD